MRDVVMQTATDEHMVVIGRQPGVRGELVSVHSADDFDGSVIAQILDSQPVVVDGTVRHQLRLQQITGTVAASGVEKDERPFDQ